MITKFQRLDRTLVNSGMVATIERSHELIQNGAVSVNGAIITSVLCPIEANHEIKISGIDSPWVSKEAGHLYDALDALKIDVKGRVAVDIGAGAGGFTEVLLQRGTKKIFAVEKEFGLLHSSLILNQRVKNIQKTDIRAVKKETFDTAFDLIVADTGPENYEEILAPVLALPESSFDLLLYVDTKENGKSIERWLRLEMKCLLKKVPDISQKYGYLIWAHKKA